SDHRLCRRGKPGAAGPPARALDADVCVRIDPWIRLRFRAARHGSGRARRRRGDAALLLQSRCRTGANRRGDHRSADYLAVAKEEILRATWRSRVFGYRGRGGNILVCAARVAELIRQNVESLRRTTTWIAFA